MYNVSWTVDSKGWLLTVKAWDAINDECTAVHNGYLGEMRYSDIPVSLEEKLECKMRINWPCPMPDRVLANPRDFRPSSDIPRHVRPYLLCRGLVDSHPWLP